MSLKEVYTAGARGLASRSMTGLARTRLTPNMLTAAGVTLCVAGGVLVYFEYRNELLFFWLGAAVFVIGSVLDILDGALARAGGKQTTFGAFIDSTTDRASEAFMLGAIGLVFMRDEQRVRARPDDRRHRRLVPRLLHACARRGARPARRRGHRLAGRAGRRHLRPA